MVKRPERLETMFALEFGQLLENHIFASSIREKEIEIVCSSLGLRSKQQLAQIYAGYDTPSTANIFELIRTLNSPEFTERFLTLQTTLLGSLLSDSSKLIPKTDTIISESVSEPEIHRPEPRRYWEDSASVLPNRVCDARAADVEWGDEDIDLNSLCFD